MLVVVVRDQVRDSIIIIIIIMHTGGSIIVGSVGSNREKVHIFGKGILEFKSNHSMNHTFDPDSIQLNHAIEYRWISTRSHSHFDS